MQGEIKEINETQTKEENSEHESVVVADNGSESPREREEGLTNKVPGRLNSGA